MKPKSQHSPQFLRKRKFLMILPVLVVPFVFIAFAAIGGGKEKKGSSSGKSKGKGFNTSLPGAHFAKNDFFMDKLGFYQKADEDSVKQIERIKQDPYHVKGDIVKDANIPPAVDPRADQFLQTLEQLKRTMRQPASIPPPGIGSIPSGSHVFTLPSHLPEENYSVAADPQMEKLNGMLDKIMRIQHPVRDTAVGADSVTTRKPLLLLPYADSALLQSDGFYSIDEAEPTDTTAQNSIPAVVEEDETLMPGATVTFRLTEDSYINGVLIPRDNLLYGTASMNNDRMPVTIRSIRCGNSIYPVSLKVYDLDGLEGIHIPGAISREVSKQSASEGVGAMELGAMDVSPGAQAANAGIQAAKTLISKKVKIIRVSVSAGYQVLLKNGNGSVK